MPKKNNKIDEPVESAKREYPLRSKRRLEARVALIKAAQQLMTERGFDEVTMQAVSHEYRYALTENLAAEFKLDLKIDLFPTLVAQIAD